MLKKLAGTLAGYKSGILACHDNRISSEPLKGTNNKIKTLLIASIPDLCPHHLLS